MNDEELEAARSRWYQAYLQYVRRGDYSSMRGPSSFEEWLVEKVETLTKEKTNGIPNT